MTTFFRFLPCCAQSQALRCSRKEPEDTPFWSKYADLLVGVVCIVSVFCFLGSRDITDLRERRISGTAADVTDHGHWLLPQLEGKPRILKPPFADWIAVGSMRLLGRNEFGFRLPFALAGLGIIFVAWATARRLFDAETGRIAALILAVTPYFISQCHSPSQDLLLSFFTGLALLLWLVWKKEGRPWSVSWWGFYVSLSLACLFKGPLALVIVSIPIVLELWVSHQWQLGVRMRPGWGVLMVIGFAFAWPIMLWLWNKDFLLQLIADVKLSVIPSQEHHGWGYFQHLGNWPWFTYPWSILGVGALFLPVWGRKLQSWSRLRFCSLWLTGTFVFFAACAKQPIHHLLPVIPAVGVIEAVLLRQFLKTIESRKIDRFGWVVAGLLSLGCVLFSFGVGFSMYSREVASLTHTLAVGGCLAIPALIGSGFLFSRPQRAFKLFVLTGVLCIIWISGWLEPPLSARRSIVSFAQGINRLVPENEPVYFTFLKDALPFYARREFVKLDFNPQSRTVVSALASRKQGYCLVTQDIYERLAALGKDHFRLEVVLRHQDSEKNDAPPLLLVHFVTRQ
ncbi:MAG: glycosyltransferase family 39 protein [Thermodesulfobacteriota bacterium]|nr:MAG: glycosyltransferase family 39 protein [Thermodesulfobacteriota bacterium]